MFKIKFRRLYTTITTDLMTGPVRVLALEDVDGVVLDLAVVGVQGRRPGQLHRPRVELHHQRLAGGARHVCNINAMGHSQNIFGLYQKYLQLPLYCV